MQTKKKTWSVRESTPADAEKIHDLMATCFGLRRPPRFEHWRYADPPFGQSLSFIAVDGDRCIAHEALLPTRMQLGKETVLGAQSMDTMTHPDYRGQGVFVATARACFEVAAERGIELLYGFPNGLSLHGLLRLNWDHTGDIQQWTRPVSLAHALPPGLATVADQLLDLLPRGRRTGVDVTVGRPDDDTLEEVLGRWRGQPKLCRVARSAAWLEWRYRPGAEMEYDWFLARRGGRPVALGVLGRRGAAWGDHRDNVDTIYELLGDDEASMSPVLAAMLDVSTARRARVVKIGTNEPLVMRLLKRAGFLLRGTRPLTVRALTARVLPENIHVHPSWRILGGDQDGF